MHNLIKQMISKLYHDPYQLSSSLKLNVCQIFHPTSFLRDSNSF